MNEREKYDGTLATASKKERTIRDLSHHAKCKLYVYLFADNTR